MLTSKQRSYLMSLAASLDPVVQVGKDGAGPEATTAMEEAFHNRELLKANVQKNCPEDAAMIADKLSKRTHSEVVKVIGRKIIFYKKDKDNPKIELP